MLWPMAGLKLGDDMVVVGSTLCVIEVDLIPKRLGCKPNPNPNPISSGDHTYYIVSQFWI